MITRARLILKAYLAVLEQRSTKMVTHFMVLGLMERSTGSVSVNTSFFCLKHMILGVKTSTEGDVIVNEYKDGERHGKATTFSH